MRHGDIMVLAGEPSGDALAAELVTEIRKTAPAGQRIPEFFGIGGPRLAQTGVALLEDMTRISVFGILGIIGKFFRFRNIFLRALAEAERRQPRCIVLVDYGGFNLCFAQAIRRRVRRRNRAFSNWNPRIVYYVLPQVWASRRRRAEILAATVDLAISIFPFEPQWYDRRYPEFPVRYVGDPMATRFAARPRPDRALTGPSPALPSIVLLPGSRQKEVDRHLPLLLQTVELLRKTRPCRATLVVTDRNQIRRFAPAIPAGVRLQIGETAQALSDSSLAIAASGAVTRECAYLGIPTVVIYKLPWLEFQIAKRLIHVPHIAMPNILAGEEIYPELIQDRAHPEALVREALHLLEPGNRKRIRTALAKIKCSLGPPGASKRAARLINELIFHSSSHCGLPADPNAPPT